MHLVGIWINCWCLGGHAHLPVLWGLLECCSQRWCRERTPLWCVMRLCLWGGLGGISSKICLVLNRLETDTIGRSLENGVLAMAAPGTGLTPPMYCHNTIVFWDFLPLKILPGGVPQAVAACSDGCLWIFREGCRLVFLERQDPGDLKF